METEVLMVWIMQLNMDRPAMERGKYDFNVCLGLVVAALDLF